VSDEDDLRLNTLHRFAKRSPRLTLEEHGHCEVPAGCGGVVLRWINPDAGPSVVVHVAALTGEDARSIELLVDGVVPATTHLQLGFGEHVLALRLTLERGGDALFACAIATETGEGEPETLVATAGDGSWRATARAPVADWAALELSDDDWTPLAASAVDVDALPRAQRWRFARLVDLGAALLALPEADELWIRRRFVVRR
jgi:hypothetical protein